MTEGDRITLGFIILISLCVLLVYFFYSGAWYKFNNQWDKGRLEYEYGEKGELILKDGLKCWKPKEER